MVKAAQDNNKNTRANNHRSNVGLEACVSEIRDKEITIYLLYFDYIHTIIRYGWGTKLGWQ